MSSSFSQYLEHDNNESESDREHLSEEDSDHQESEDNWDENSSEDEDCREVEGNWGSSTFDEMRARLRWWSKKAARSKETARSVIFDGCSARVVSFLRLSNALEGVRESFRGRFWLRLWGISKTVTRTSGTSTNKEIWIASILGDFGQLGGRWGWFSNSSYKRITVGQSENECQGMQSFLHTLIRQSHDYAVYR